MGRRQQNLNGFEEIFDDKNYCWQKIAISCEIWYEV